MHSGCRRLQHRSALYIEVALVPAAARIKHDPPPAPCRDALQRTILPLIANELLQRLQQATGIEGSRHAASAVPPHARSPLPATTSHDPLPQRRSTPGLPAVQESSDDGSSANGGRMSSSGLSSAHGSRQGPAAAPSSHNLLAQLRARTASFPGLDAIAGSVHGTMPRTRSDLFLATVAMHEGSVHGRSRMRRGPSTSSVRAMEQIKAARCNSEMAVSLAAVTLAVPLPCACSQWIAPPPSSVPSGCWH